MYFVYIHSIWVNYNISLTWIVRPFGVIPLTNYDFVVRENSEVVMKFTQIAKKKKIHTSRALEIIDHIISQRHGLILTFPVIYLLHGRRSPVAVAHGFLVHSGSVVHHMVPDLRRIHLAMLARNRWNLEVPIPYTLWLFNIAIENDHRNSGFTQL